MSQTDQVNEVNIGEELRKAEVEPLLPVEKKLIGWSLGIGVGPRKVTAFVQAQLLNVFNQFQLCACGSTVFGTGSAANAGGVNLQRLDTTVLSPGTTSRYAAFDPFT